MDLAEKVCKECPARAANNCPYENYPHLKRKCEYRSDVMYGYDLAMAELEKKIKLVKANGSWDGVDIDKFMNELRGRD